MKSRLFAVALAVTGLSICAPCLSAQDSTASQSGTLRVFLDCFFCDSRHFRREVSFVNYVNDRQVADIHVLGTRQRTGAGQEFTFEFIGLRRFAGQSDTLRLQSSTTDTSDEIREGQTRLFALGLIPFLTGTPIALRLRVLYLEPEDEEQRGVVGEEDDPWNFWVFRISGSGRLNGESSRRGYGFGGSFSADRITDEWKFEFEGDGNVSRSEIDIDEDSTFVDTRRNYEFEGRVVRSLGLEHWATAVEASASASTFNNQDKVLRGAVGIEYSVFPFSESTRRQLTVLYSIGVSQFNYEEITLFGFTEETRADHRLNVSYSVRQPWGTSNASFNFSNYLHDFSLHRARISGRLNLRIVRGLDLNIRGGFSRIKDQIFLPAGGISEEEILLRRRALGTDFQYDLSFGLTFRFGSIFNNVVNPRRGV